VNELATYAIVRSNW